MLWQDESGAGTGGCHAPTGRRPGECFARAARSAGTSGPNPLDPAATRPARPPAPPPQAAPPPPVSHSAPPSADLRSHEPAPSAAIEQTSAILKSGVVDGMAYTLYADGSIEAKLPDGTVRFGSITELRAHIEKNP